MTHPQHATLLVELLTEELPPKALARLGDAFTEGIAQRLAARDLIEGELSFERYATPAAIADAEFAILAAEIRRLRATGAEVVVVGATPTAIRGEPELLYSRAFWTHDLPTLTQTRASYETRVAMTRTRLVWLSQTTGARLLDPLDGFCPGGVCPITADGRAIYKDQGHFRASLMPTPRFAYLDAALLPSRLK